MTVAIDLSKRLVIGISSRALFDLEDANRVYDEKGKKAYVKYQLRNQEKVLASGTAFRLVQAILELNKRAHGVRKAEVVVMSKNDPATSLRLFNSIKHYNLDVQQAALVGGAPLAQYLHAFNVDLFLSKHEQDVRGALAAGVASAVIYDPPGGSIDPGKELRIAFDGDAVVFSDESERIYQSAGLAAFLEHEKINARKPLPEGPFAKLLQTLSGLQRDRGFDSPPVRIALVTARGLPAHERVLRTLLAWNVHVDEAFFMSGGSKTKILEAFRPHIFFDDQEIHCQPASEVVSTGRVPSSLCSVISEPKGVQKPRTSRQKTLQQPSEPNGCNRQRRSARVTGDDFAH
jgi:5'-nucleotidase